MEKCRKNHPECPFRLSKIGCRVILHHLWYPEGDYSDNPVEKKFRELLTNRVPMCEYEEKQLHLKQPNGPPKPSYKVMEHVVGSQALRQELAVRPLRRP